jgi:predicted TIM-barrel fold metal-dependent hydrolase
MIRKLLLLTAFLASACAHRGGPAPDASTGPATPTSQSRQPVPAPLVDHHQHLMSERGIGPAPTPLPDVELPAPLQRVLDERYRVMETGEPGDLFTDDARVLDPVANLWGQGPDAVGELATTYTPDTRFFANGYSVGDSLAVVTGVIRTPPSTVDELTFVLGLEKDAAGEWRIATEAATLIPPRPFSEPVTADLLVGELDAAGIGRAVVLSVAYWFGEPDGTWPGDEYENVRAENDWTAEQVARHPDRLIAFCSVNPLKEYAVEEVRRCATQLGTPGLKLHFANSGVDVHDPAQVEKVRLVFEAANELGLAIVVHSRTDGEYGREEARIILEEIFPAAPNVPIQIAHLWGGAAFSAEALGVFADAVSSGDPRARNLYFDLTEVDKAAGDSEETWSIMVERIRQIGLDRILYGSDMTSTPGGPPSALGWSRLRRKAPLTEEELATIARNVAPYLQDGAR